MILHLSHLLLNELHNLGGSVSENAIAILPLLLLDESLDENRALNVNLFLHSSH